ncbi:histidine kinase dimerization/phosphoacceptor domain -containing protein [Arenibaculum pallidiluteum]|uniref:histidine kinase dimerization/phosphoacceptor domain -containing protein n=1 Tax=Arenibaculum pallidiluteum TaxID=2812559 RepID=UPI001A968056|nr:histidine kinase dimerization/phosphoacceptor domain -containing protein [Arenibaculum pallidiluteum]
MRFVSDEAAVFAKLDDLSAAELDSLDYGVLKLDGSGTILFYSAAESALSGRRREAVLGRNFFRDVAPCTNLPSFFGRFLEGVRRGALDERLDFVFGFDPSAPQRVRVHMRGANEPGRYWVMVVPLERLQGNRPILALAAVEGRARAEDIDLDICAREPIHIPGSIQPQGVLLVVDPATLRVSVASANAETAFGQEAAVLLGRPLAELLGSDFAAAVQQAAVAGAIPGDHPYRQTVTLAGRRQDTVSHLHGGKVLIELEPAPAPEDFPSPQHADLQEAVSRLRDAASVFALGQVLAETARSLTGFERVVVYRFDEDWHGEAVAEDRSAGMQPLLGLRFPASDIPAQARDLYTRSRSRFVVDRDYVPVPLVGSPDAAAPVDLSFAQLRSLSPVHLEYQRNLGVNGSMSVAVMTAGRLWGLLIGHHRRPHYVAPEARLAVRILADTFALRLQELEGQIAWDRQQRHLEVQSRLLCQMAGSDDWVAALAAGETTILDLFGAGGAAVVWDGKATPIGETPLPDAILELAAWLRHRPFQGRIFFTDRLPHEHPAFASYARVASGVLAAAVNESRETMLLWFRPEVVGTVVWSGDPRKPLADEGSGLVLPRRSFERWVEERAGISASWPRWHADIARTLTGAIEDVILRHQRKVRELQDKQRALTESVAAQRELLDQKDLLAREIDHRVKNSLQIVASILQMQGRRVRDEEARQALVEAQGRVMGISRVHESLFRSTDARLVDLGQTVRNLCNDLAAMAGPLRHLAATVEPGIHVDSAVAVSLALVTAELVTNAFKYAYAPDEDGGVAVSVARSQDAAMILLRVADQGRGLPPDWHEHGSDGLGMRLVQGMLARISGHLEVESRDGAAFTCLVPA